MMAWPGCARSRAAVLVVAFQVSAVGAGILGSPAGAAALTRYTYDQACGSRVVALVDCVTSADSPSTGSTTLSETFVGLSGRPLCLATCRTATNSGLVDELAASGVKHNPAVIVRIGRGPSGQITFLENGTSQAGLKYILGEHADDFARAGNPEASVPDLVMDAVTKGKIVGYQGAGTGRPIYEVEFGGRAVRVGVTTGSNDALGVWCMVWLGQDRLVLVPR